MMPDKKLQPLYNYTAVCPRPFVLLPFEKKGFGSPPQTIFFVFFFSIFAGFIVLFFFFKHVFSQPFLFFWACISFFFTSQA